MSNILEVAGVGEWRCRGRDRKSDVYALKRMVVVVGQAAGRTRLRLRSGISPVFVWCYLVWATATRLGKIHPASRTKCETRPLPALLPQEIIAAEGGANKQRPRLLLGRSVFHPHLNAALPIFQHPASFRSSFIFILQQQEK